jgi:hypothetical protein
MAVVLAVVASHAESLRGVGSARVLNWLDAYGLVPPPESTGIVELTNPSALLLTDEIAIQWLLTNSASFAVYAISFALWAEFKRESTLYAGAGFACGSSALLLHSPAGSMLAMIVGALSLGLLRRYHGA